MNNLFNDKHLLWWVMRAIDACRAEGTRRDTLLSETLWKNLGAPEWVLPALREKYEIYDPGRPVPKHGSVHSPILSEDGKMTEITVGLCESFRAIGIDISEADLRKFERALYERGLNVAPRAAAKAEPVGDASGSYMGTGSAYWNSNLNGR